MVYVLRVAFGHIIRITEFESGALDADGVFQGVAYADDGSGTRTGTYPVKYHAQDNCTLHIGDGTESVGDAYPSED